MKENVVFITFGSDRDAIDHEEIITVSGRRVNPSDANSANFRGGRLVFRGGEEQYIVFTSTPSSAQIRGERST